MPFSRKTEEEIKTLRQGGMRLAIILRDLARAARPGVSTKDLDAMAERMIRAAGGDTSSIVKVTIFLTSMSDYMECNEEYERFFKEHTPARTVVESPRLPKGALVEIDCVACVLPA